MTRCTVARGRIAQNYHPRGAVDDPMHCCPRPKASGNSASGNSASGHPQHLVGDSFDCCTERYEIVVYCSMRLNTVNLCSGTNLTMF